MPELTDNQIADLRDLQHRCAALRAELVIIGAIAYQIHFPAESRHTVDIDFAVALDFDEFAKLERRLLADGWVSFANREHRWRSAQGTILDLIPSTTPQPDGNFLNAPSSTPSTERASSDYDIRHTFSGAVSYDIPRPDSVVLKQIFGNWSTDTIIYVRSAPPVNVVTGKVFPGTVTGGANSLQRPDVVPGVPFYLHPSGAPGGKVINKVAFTTPIPATAQGDLGRNALRGFGATQWDITLRRQFRFTERFSLQFRVDFFNILNHPNFGNPINYLTSPQFGQSTQMLNNYLGSGGQSGGLNPLYQIGGPRSIQLALKLQF